MALPFFFQEQLPTNPSFTLSEETSRHIFQVLRMQAGEQIKLTNGKGQVLTGEIIASHKKNTGVRVITTDNLLETKKISIAISLLKNNNRLEWFFEKATEIGVTEIIPLICERTERQYFRYERMKNILVSAMLQSQQVWLPVLQKPVKFKELVKKSFHKNKYIAHCIEQEKQHLSNQFTNVSGDSIILIGPEGDFTKEEIEYAGQHNFIPVSLGNTRLRTETAGIVAAVLLKFTG